MEAYIEELKREIKRHQDEVEKAIKIHRANEKLSAENETVKGYSEKLAQELKVMRSERDKDNERYQELLKHVQTLSKGNNSSSSQQLRDGPCRNCLKTLEEREHRLIEVEDLKR